MPILSMFYGIIVSMYYLDNKKHNLPHIYVKYQDQEVVICLPNGQVLEGSFPPAKLKLLVAWIEIHKDELMADWDLAVQGQPLFKIDPLK